MDKTNGPVPDASVVNTQETNGNVPQMEILNQLVDEIFTQVDQFEQQVNEIDQFYSGLNTKQPNTKKSGSSSKDKYRVKLLASFKKKQQEAARRDAAATKRMQELMRQFGTILRQITQHKWAVPFMHPVDVVGLGLHDYYKVIEKPMDFSTIKKNMKARDGTGYKNVREICADVRLIFNNAMTYNEERNDVHVMAKTLLDKFETKWLQLLPKIDEEEKRRKEEAEMKFDSQLAQEASHAKVARKLRTDLDEIDAQLVELKEMVLQMCRKMSTEEKRRLGTAITRLSPENLDKALEIIAQSNSNFQTEGENVEIDLDAQGEYTLWKLKFFVKNALQAQVKIVPRTQGIKKQRDNNQNSSNREQEICDALAKISHKKSKKLPS